MKKSGWLSACIIILGLRHWGGLGGVGGRGWGGCWVEGSTPLSRDEKWELGVLEWFFGLVGGVRVLVFSDVVWRPLCVFMHRGCTTLF